MRDHEPLDMPFEKKGLGKTEAFLLDGMGELNNFLCR